MAQPPEPFPLRLQSSLDSVPVEPRVQPELDALALKHYHHGQAQQQQQQDRQSSGLSQASDAPSTNGNSGANSIDRRSERTPDVAIGKATSNGVSAVNTSPNHHASVAALIGSPQDTHGTHGTRSEAQHNRDALAPKPPDMSNPQPPPRPARQPMTYASSVSYPPAGVPSVSHYAYPPQTIQTADPYRPTPTTLPSMRTLDHGQPQAQPPHGLSLSAHMAAPMTPAPAPVPMAYYAIHPHAHVYGLSDPNAMRFPLGPNMGHDPRIAMSGGRHKKVPTQRDGRLISSVE